MKQALALFDFDGTITTRDSLFEFIKFYRGSFKFYIGMAALSPVLGFQLYLLRDRSKAKETVLRFYLKNIKLSDFNEACKQFVRQQLPLILNPDAILTIKKHLKNNDRIIVVSASPENWIMEWCNLIEIECIGTKLQSSEQRLTGLLASLNCNEKEKVKRISEVVRLKEYYPIYAYGDSKGDKAMLALANHQFYKRF